MLKKLTIFVLGVVLFMSACVRHERFFLPERETSLYTIEEAEKAYELARMGLSRSDAEDGVLTMGEYLPDWSGAEISIDSTLYSADVPIDGEYAYYRYLEIEDEVFWIPLYPKLVTVTTPEKEHSSAYIRYYVPHEYYEWSHDPEVYDQLLNSLPKGDFTGLSLYTTLSGDPVCVARYSRGRLKEYGFLYDKAYSLEENVAIMRRILKGLKIGRAVVSVSRGNTDNSGGDPTIDGGIIEEVPIYPPKSDPLDDGEFPDEEEWAVLPIPGMGSGGSGGLGGAPGGGGGTSSDDDEEYPNGTKSSKYNEHITYEDEEILEPLLDSIAKDCMGGTLLEGLGNVTIVTNSDRNYYNSEKNTIYLINHPVYGYRDYVFLEELIHAYQSQNREDAAGRVLDNEIEAKVGWLLYKQRVNTPLSQQQQKKAFKSLETSDAFYLLATYHQIRLPYNNDHFIFQYTMAARGLVDIGGYQHLAENYNWNNIKVDFSILTVLMINCPEL